MATTRQRPKLSVWKFASCDGCQLSLLDLEEELLGIAEVVEIRNFAEATRAFGQGPYDISLVDGSVTTEHDAQLIRRIRDESRILIPIGACAVAGGIQGLKNFRELGPFVKQTYPRPEWIHTLSTSTPIAAHVPVDYELHGCPVNKWQLLETLSAFLAGRKPTVASTSVCTECKRRGTVCVMVAYGTPCMGPVTHAGCGAICPFYDRGCYGCYGPMETPNTASLSGWFEKLGASDEAILRAYRSFNAASEPFKNASLAIEEKMKHEKND